LRICPPSRCKTEAHAKKLPITWNRFESICVIGHDGVLNRRLTQQTRMEEQTMNIATANASTNEAANATQTSPPLTRDEIAGNFSLLGNGPMVIDATPGLILQVRSGMVQICHPEEEGHQLVEDGEIVVLDRKGELALAPITRAEVRLEWPLVQAAPLARTNAIPGEDNPLELYAWA
jgi:hypothetical protein